MARLRLKLRDLTPRSLVTYTMIHQPNLTLQYDSRRVLGQEDHVSKATDRGDRSVSTGRMDGLVSTAARSPGHFAGRMGAGQFASVIWRRDPNFALQLWPEPALFENGCSCFSTLEGSREALEPEVAEGKRCALDGESGE